MTLTQTRKNFFAVILIVLFLILIGQLRHALLFDVPATPLRSPTSLADSTTTIVQNGSSDDALDVIRRRNSILLVTAYFPLTKSKHDDSEYKLWLEHFLPHIQTPIYFYTSSAYAPLIRELRGGLPIFIDTTFSSPFDIPPLQGRHEHYESLHKMDPERDHHSPDLYAVWNAKPWFLANGLQNYPLSPWHAFSFAFWIDAGSFRSQHSYRDWPDAKRVQDAWDQHMLNRPETENHNEILFWPIDELPQKFRSNWTDEDGPFDMGDGHSYSIGSFFGGQLDGISWYSKQYYHALNHYFNEGHFVGKDQTVINAIFMLFPSHFISIWPSNPEYAPLGACGNRWYYHQFFLASDSERSNMRSIWRSQWLTNLWTHGLEAFIQCRAVSSEDMTSLLRKRFGSDWNSPPIQPFLGD
ncbi:hypothetical protein SISNIDRAFT_410501 [Sistotremastrum niveocremeum HHB9708]|uniref:Uncharacterized protein n=2 Tax=Sistotremastraceae TaxID=3402574 RepID=A0A164VEH2_9AGAM|nr:hypothetical protein SISNIDRAFT_410501 [Sistotremastrum niveocremeum HHB9708]KZT32027.1 hypothetical protein SISSUDRAFT_994466 [Sistotremastrum suecicum HHB10207 ss-3]